MAIEKKLIDKFLIFEEKKDLFDVNFLGVNVWPIIRFRLYSSLYSKVNSTQVAHPKNKKIFSLFLIIKSLFLSIVKSPFFLKKKDMIVFNHGRRVENKKKYYECKYTEHISNKDSYVFEAPFFDQHYTPTQTKNLVYLDLVLNISRIFSLFGSVKKLSNSDESIVNSIIQDIENEFNVALPDLKKFIIISTLKHKALLYLSKIILSRIKPSKIVMAVGYSDINMPFVEQAKNLGIKVVEQQHGIMGSSHAAYNFLYKREFNWFPDEIWVWNKYWSEHTRFPISDSRVLVKGFRYLEKFKKSHKINTKKKQIIFISQGPFSERLIELCINLSKRIDLKQYQIAFRPHPSELAANFDKFKSLIKHNIFLFSENNIYENFNDSTYQVGVNSTALFEGLEFGLKTFIFKISDWEMFENVDSVIFIDNEKDILDNL